jgi:DNA-binding GntR family transcriptional regulator
LKDDLKQALQEFKEQTGFDFMKLLSDNDEKEKWRQRLAEDKKRIEESEMRKDKMTFEETMQQFEERKKDFYSKIWALAEKNVQIDMLQWRWKKLKSIILDMKDNDIKYSDDIPQSVLFGILCKMEELEKK